MLPNFSFFDFTDFTLINLQLYLIPFQSKCACTKKSKKKKLNENPIIFKQHVIDYC